MLSLGIAHKWPLLSLTRICENGKWKICRPSTVDRPTDPSGFQPPPLT